jgi:hypothetical protein
MLNTTATRTCETCEAGFEPRRKSGRWQRFCSKACRRASYSPGRRGQYAVRIANGMCGSCGLAPCGANSECENCRARHRDRAREIRVEAIQHYGGMCACCGEKRFEFLAIDHIDGGGNEHRRQIAEAGQRNSNFTQWLKKNGFPAGFRVLCHNCNMARGFYGQCPHEKEN